MLSKLVMGLTVMGVVAFAGCSSELAAVSPKQAEEMFVANKAIILDVREPDEWQAQHIAGAIHIPLAQVENRLSELAEYKTSGVIVQCRSGKRSAKAAAMLMSAGFGQVYNLTGGINAWTSDGFKTVSIK